MGDQADLFHSCAYKVANRGGFVFAQQRIYDFSAMTSMDQFYQAGWTVSHGYQAGATNEYTGQSPIASENNVKLVRGQGITLTVPGGEFQRTRLDLRILIRADHFSTSGQSRTASTFSSAEIIFPDIALGGIFQVEARMTGVSGVIFGVFTNHADPWNASLGWNDEQDLEIISSALMTSNGYNPPGIQMTEFDPK